MTLVQLSWRGKIASGSLFVGWVFIHFLKIIQSQVSKEWKHKLINLKCSVTSPKFARVLNLRKSPLIYVIYSYPIYLMYNTTIYFTCFQAHYKWLKAHPWLENWLSVYGCWFRIPVYAHSKCLEIILVSRSLSIIVAETDGRMTTNSNKCTTDY